MIMGMHLTMKPTLIASELKIFQKKSKKFIGNKNIIINICRIQAFDSMICGYIRIVLIDFMLKSKSLLDYTNLFCPNEH